MARRVVGRLMLLSAATFAIPLANGQGIASERLHAAAIVVDAHSDFLDRSVVDQSRLSDDPEGSQTTLGKLEAGQVDAQFFSIFVPPAYREYGYAGRTLELIDRLLLEVERNSDRIEMATSVAAIRRIAAEEKIAALMGIEGGHSIENRLEHLRNYYRLGVRYMTLTWTNTNDWADSSGDTPRWSGLNDFGLRVVAEMNRLGMMIDISHVSDDTFWDVIRNSRSPVIASHSAARALVDSDRNISDEMIVALAEAGGVIQVTFYSKHLQSAFASRYDQAVDEAAATFNRLGDQYLHDPIGLDIAQWSLEKEIERSIPPIPLSAVVDHIDHIVDLAGIDHVGLGSDFDGMGSAPVGLEHVGMMPAITEELVRRGYDEAGIRKILGENLLRVMAENESRADKR